MPLPTVAAITRSLLRTLAYLHAKRLVHRELRPETVLLQDDSYVRVCARVCASVCAGRWVVAVVVARDASEAHPPSTRPPHSVPSLAAAGPRVQPAHPPTRPP